MGPGFASRGFGFAPRGGMHGPGRPSFASAPRPSFRFGNAFHPGHPGRGPVFVQRGHGDFHHGHGDFDEDRDLDSWRFAIYTFGAYPYSYGSYGGPLWDWETSSYDRRDTNPTANYDAQYQSAAEMRRLADEVEQLREERANTQAAAPAPVAPRPEAKVQEDLPVVLVFLDKHIQEVKNYAVANEMLVVFDGNRRKKYPLADIDLAATMKLNDERCVDFQVPNPVMN
jgi:hypothetical protein